MVEKSEVTIESENKVLDDLNDEVEKTSENKLEQLKAQLKAKKNAIKEQEVITIVEKKKKSLVFGMIGSGQSGSRIVSIFANEGGYPTVVLNTAQQDLEYIQLPESNKLLLDSGAGIGGAAKDMDVGRMAAELNRDAIAEIISDKLTNVDVYVFCTSLGGGSGAGSHEIVLDILASKNIPIVVISVLPSSNEDMQTKQNALSTLASLAKKTQEGTISNLFVVDNSKLEIIYSNVGHQDFFTVANKAIFSTIDAFNYYSIQPSMSKPLDSAEFYKIFVDGGGIGLTGELDVTGFEGDDSVLAQAAIESLENNLLASGFSLEQAKFAGVIFVANEQSWKNVPQGAIGYCQAIIREQCPGHEGVFHGSYSSEEIDDGVVKIYTMFSGLGLPDSRVSQLQKEVEAEKGKTKERAQARNVNLTVNIGKDTTTSKADEIRAKIQKNTSKFAQRFNNGGVKDFRKK
jgi:cell division GTPase FtsZ